MIIKIPRNKSVLVQAVDSVYELLGVDLIAPRWDLGDATLPAGLYYLEFNIKNAYEYLWYFMMNLHGQAYAFDGTSHFINTTGITLGSQEAPLTSVKHQFNAIDGYWGWDGRSLPMPTFNMWLQLAASTTMAFGGPTEFDGCIETMSIWKVTSGTLPARFGNAINVHGFTSVSEYQQENVYRGIYTPDGRTFGSNNRNVYSCSTNSYNMWQDGNYWNLGQLVYILGGAYEGMYRSGTTNGRPSYSGMDYNTWNDYSLRWTGTQWEYWLNVWDQNWEYQTWTLTDYNTTDSYYPPTSGWHSISISLGTDPMSWGGSIQSPGTGEKPNDNYKRDGVDNRWGVSYEGVWSHYNLIASDYTV